MKTVLRFIAASDLHMKTDSDKERDRLLRGMELAYRYADADDYKKIDALYLNGDFANHGLQEEMERVKATVGQCVRPETEVVYTLASHEFMASDGEAGAVLRFESLFGQTPDCHKIIGGYHFISITTESGCHIYEKKQAWLKKQLQIAAKDYPKPIFVFQHPHLTDTVYGSILWGEDEIIPILMDYPGVVDFSGHSHAPVNDPRSIHQKYFTCHGTGSFSYFELDEFDKITGTIPADAEQCAQFLIVEVREDDSVLIRPFDILSGEFFGVDRLIETPWEPQTFIYTDARYRHAVKPVFKEGSAPFVAVTGENVEIRFPQADCTAERPDSYTVRIRDLSSGQIIRQINVTSSYYLYHMPEMITVNVPSVSPGKYAVHIVANSFWETQSEPLCAEFEVK